MYSPTFQLHFFFFFNFFIPFSTQFVIFTFSSRSHFHIFISFHFHSRSLVQFVLVYLVNNTCHTQHAARDVRVHYDSIAGQKKNLWKIRQTRRFRRTGHVRLHFEKFRPAHPLQQKVVQPKVGKKTCLTDKMSQLGWQKTCPSRICSKDKSQSIIALVFVCKAIRPLHTSAPLTIDWENVGPR